MEYIYFCIKNPYNNRVKVGKSKDPVARLKSLSTGNEDELIMHHLIKTSVSINLERKIHDYLKKTGKHLRLEWFNLTMNELTELIAKYKKYDIENMEKIRTIMEDLDTIIEEKNDDEFIECSDEGESDYFETESEESGGLGMIKIDYEESEQSEQSEILETESEESDSEQIKKYKCEICNKSFATNKELRRHLNRKNPCGNGKKEYKCDICDKKFRDNCDLNRHLNNKKISCDKNMRQEKIVYKCDICNKPYITKRNLNIHMDKCNKIDNNKIMEEFRDMLKKQNDELNEIREMIKNRIV
jgi:hypothetical protein